MTANATHLEIEIKLDAEPEVQLPDLSTVPGVARVGPVEQYQLEASYLDSADLRLALSGTTLRRRTGGTDSGWHLKLPAAKGIRVEVQRPLGDHPATLGDGRPERPTDVPTDVPADLLGLTRGRLRGEPVAPVARISTLRTVYPLLDQAGGVLALVADDHVTGEAFGVGEPTVSTWREIEVELVEGSQDLLSAAVDTIVAAGARPSASASKLARTLEHRLGSRNGARPKGRSSERPGADQAGAVVLERLGASAALLLAEDPRVRLEAEDAVHQMRVAARTLRSLLATFGRVFRPGAVDGLRDELQWIGSVLAATRDAEVQREILDRMVAEQPAELVLGPVRRRIRLELNREYRQAFQASLLALDGDRYLALLDALDGLLAEPPLAEPAFSPAEKELTRAVRRAYRKLARAADRAAAHPAGSPEHDHELHEVRKAAKRTRYTAEAVELTFGDPAEQLAEAAEAVQEILGDHQDTVVLRGRLRALGVQAQLAGENAFTFGRLHGLAEGRAILDEQDYQRAWQAVHDAAERWPG